jgi:putrescine transport system substrate-binding protein
VSRRIAVAITLLAAVAVGAAGGCGTRTGGAAAAGDRELSIYNWADFIGKHTIAEFEQATGIKVDYDTFDSDATLEAKMLAGGSGYDIVGASTNYYSRQIKAGAYQRLDRKRLSNWHNNDPRILALMAESDPGNAHAVPYLHAINGFAYNVDMIRVRMADAPLDSLDLIFRPENIRRFADCGVTFLDSAEDVLQLALNYLHFDPNSSRPEDFKAAEALILAVRPYIRTFDSVEYMSGLANQELCVAMSWSSDYAVAMARARAVGVAIRLAFTVPKEGANATYYGWLIPYDAQHVAAAHEFLDFMMRPEVIATVTNETHYGNDNLTANRFVEPTILADPTLYPTPEVMAHLYLTNEVSAATERIRTRTWTRIKTAR